MADTYDSQKYIDKWTYQFNEQRHAVDAIERSRANIVDKPAQPMPKDAPVSKDHGER
jgi:hypothetical protein